MCLSPGDGTLEFIRLVIFNALVQRLFGGPRSIYRLNDGVNVWLTIEGVECGDVVGAGEGVDRVVGGRGAGGCGGCRGIGTGKTLGNLCGRGSIVEVGA